MSGTYKKTRLVKGSSVVAGRVSTSALIVLLKKKKTDVMSRRGGLVYSTRVSALRREKLYTVRERGNYRIESARYHLSKTFFASNALHLHDYGPDFLREDYSSFIYTYLVPNTA